ncbi:hypothetical protein HS088_TW21G01792 [Tripterygium wilfordii]|uniref:Mitochondrial substrate carrier family protein B-like n=1 Tax=Tripterygium wilfordii TaxID=458696 RepID=A0A7J7C6P7_TRIWF|nr:hypothetical protein HS088_TW21G01792 [Tripterygium wilfordii]
MQTESRVGVVVEGGQRAMNSTHGAVAVAVDRSGARKLSRIPQQQPTISQIGTISQLLAGGVAGALSKSCTAPLARLTILFQVQGMHTDAATLRKASIWREASRIVSEEGFRAFWKGNLVTITHRLPYSSVNFYAYEHYKKFLHSIPGLANHKEKKGVDLFVHFIGGGLAGITAASTTYPLDLVRTRLAAQTNVMYYRGIWHALQTISREEGVLGLYKGLGATLLVCFYLHYILIYVMSSFFGLCLTAGLSSLQGVGPSLAISFSVYEYLRSFWQSNRPQDSTVVVSLACGSLSGIASSTVAFPLDLVRRRKQLEGAGGRACVYKTGLFGIFRHIIKAEGFRGLYRGIMAEYYKVVPGVGICFMTYETLKIILADVTAKL